MVASEAPNRYSMGRFSTSPRMVSARPQMIIIIKEFPMIASASWSFPFPRWMEHKGAPPMPNKLAKAITMDIIGRQSPSPVRAMVAFWGMRPI